MLGALHGYSIRILCPLTRLIWLWLYHATTQSGMAPGSEPCEDSSSGHGYTSKAVGSPGPKGSSGRGLFFKIGILECPASSPSLDCISKGESAGRAFLLILVGC